jgi:hypothetical protein
MDLRHRLLHLIRKLHPPSRPATPPIHSPRRRYARVPMHSPSLQSRRGQGLHEEGPFSRASEEFPSHGYSETEAWGEISVSLWVARGRGEPVSTSEGGRGQKRRTELIGCVCVGTKGPKGVVVRVYELDVAVRVYEHHYRESVNEAESPSLRDGEDELEARAGVGVEQQG